MSAPSFLGASSTRESLADDLDLEYPMLWEAEDRSMEISAPEINRFVDIVLSTGYKYGGNRSITFSSFSPEICILLTIKQQQYPILFINKAGSVPTGDIREANLQQAILSMRALAESKSRVGKASNFFYTV